MAAILVWILFHKSLFNMLMELTLGQLKLTHYLPNSSHIPWAWLDLEKGKWKQEWEGGIVDLKTAELIFIAEKYSIHSFPF